MDEQVRIVRTQQQKKNLIFTMQLSMNTQAIKISMYTSVCVYLVSKSCGASLVLYVLFHCLAAEVTSGNDSGSGSGSGNGKTATVTATSTIYWMRPSICQSAAGM